MKITEPSYKNQTAEVSRVGGEFHSSCDLRLPPQTAAPATAAVRAAPHVTAQKYHFNIGAMLHRGARSAITPTAYRSNCPLFIHSHVLVRGGVEALFQEVGREGSGGS